MLLTVSPEIFLNTEDWEMMKMLSDADELMRSLVFMLLAFAILATPIVTVILEMVFLLVTVKRPEKITRKKKSVFFMIDLITIFLAVVMLLLTIITGADDLKAIEGLSGTGFLKRTGNNTLAIGLFFKYFSVLNRHSKASLDIKRYLISTTQ